MRLIDADALLAAYDLEHVGPPGRARKLIEEAPDAVVRCKDCIYHKNQGSSLCWLPCMEIMTGDNWFCWNGKRRER